MIDLDGTILNTVHPSWKPFKDGLDNYQIDKHLNALPYFRGAKEFIHKQQQEGNVILIVSDSHPKYVAPISKHLRCECVSLADKPNSSKLLSYLNTHHEYKEMLKTKDCVFIGDTVLDIELGRQLAIPTIWILPYTVTKEIINCKDKVGDKMACLKMGPTYSVHSFEEINQIINDPINHLYAIESIFSGGKSSKAIKYTQNRFSNGSYAAIRCLARQESGECDKYARADKYFQISNPDRSIDFMKSLASGVNCFIKQQAVANQSWDYITYIPDKKTTVPQNKMKDIFNMIETSIPKIELFKWADTVEGSLRKENLYNTRKEFLEKYLIVNAINIEKYNDFHKDTDNIHDVRGKNIIIIDDQLTTGATAWFAIHNLKEKGANNILFIALFQMIFYIGSNILCPNCGKTLAIKIRRHDGYKFYSCVPPKFGGNGCGYIIDYQSDKETFTKYLKIISKYQWAFKEFIKGRKDISHNMLQFVVDSEDKIQLISEMHTYPMDFISDKCIEELYSLREKVNKLLNCHPLRAAVWKEWAINNMNNDYWDNPKDIMIWALNNIDKLDKYIKKNGN